MTPQPTRLKTYPFPRDPRPPSPRNSDSTERLRAIELSAYRNPQDPDTFFKPSTWPYYVRKWSNESNTGPQVKNLPISVPILIRLYVWVYGKSNGGSSCSNRSQRVHASPLVPLLDRFVAQPPSHVRTRGETCFQ